MRLTILFETPYWIGVLEDERDGYLYAARYIFGAEPSMQLVYAVIQREWTALCARMTVGVPIDQTQQTHVNPKRMQREVRREQEQQGVTSKAHEALRLQIEQGKQTRREKSRQERDAERAYRRERERAKAKAKHRGR